MSRIALVNACVLAGEHLRDGLAVVIVCDTPLGYSALPGDCDDADASTFPGAEERCAPAGVALLFGAAACVSAGQFQATAWLSRLIPPVWLNPPST